MVDPLHLGNGEDEFSERAVAATNPSFRSQTEQTTTTLNSFQPPNGLNPFTLPLKPKYIFTSFILSNTNLLLYFINIFSSFVFLLKNTNLFLYQQMFTFSTLCKNTNLIKMLFIYKVKTFFR